MSTRFGLFTKADRKSIKRQDVAARQHLGMEARCLAGSRQVSASSRDYRRRLSTLDASEFAATSRLLSSPGLADN